MGKGNSKLDAMREQREHAWAQQYQGKPRVRPSVDEVVQQLPLAPSTCTPEPPIPRQGKSESKPAKGASTRKGGKRAGAGRSAAQEHARGVQLGVRLTDEEGALVRAAASKAGQPLSAWARAALLRAAQG